MKWISPFDEPKKQLEDIHNFAPHVGYSYPSCFRVLAKWNLEHGLQEITIPLIFTTGEILDETTRRVIEKAFNSELFESYGTNEIGSIACECTEHNFQFHQRSCPHGTCS